jgi:hypothetical protein
VLGAHRTDDVFVIVPDERRISLNAMFEYIEVFHNRHATPRSAI